ncbi:MAG: 5-(carboxyamino)imidazole ribonucleotide synthase, partial [Actinomycetales bacterium]
APWTGMVNVLGGTVDDLDAALVDVLTAVPEAKVHLYGKAVKPGRKVGHVTVTGTQLDATLDAARRAVALLEGAPHE